MAEGQADIAGVADFLRAFVKAMKMVQFYPPNNPMPAQMVQTAYQQLGKLHLQSLVLAVDREGFSHQGERIAADSFAFQQLALKLYVLGIDRLHFAQGLSTSEVTIACKLMGKQVKDIAALGRLSSQLAAAGVSHLTLHESRPPEIIEIEEAPAQALIKMITQREEGLQHALSSARGRKGGPRADGMAALSMGAHLDIPSISPQELADVIATPSQLLELLHQGASAQGEAAESWHSEPIERLGEVIGYLELAEELSRPEAYQTIARSIGKLDTEEQQQLLHQVLLPALGEGKEEGELVRFFSDHDLVHAIADYREQTQASMEGVAQAFTELGLPERRRAALLPLLEHAFTRTAPEDKGKAVQEAWRRALARSSREQGALESLRGQRLSTMQFEPQKLEDITLEPEEEELIAIIRQALAQPDSQELRLAYLINLLSLEGNVEIAAGFVAQIDAILREITEGESWAKLAYWIRHVGSLAHLEERRRPAIANLITEMLGALSEEQLISHLVEQYHQSEDEGVRREYLAAMQALGDFAVPTYVHLLEKIDNRSLRRTVLNVLLELSPSLSPAAFAPYLTHRRWFVVRNTVWILGRMGKGTENMLLEATRYPHERVRTEAIRSLAMLATPQSIDYLFRLLEHGDRSVRRTSVEFVSSLPPPMLESHLAELLTNREFVAKDHVVSCTLFEAVCQMDTPGVAEIIADIARLRFAFWSPRRIRIGIAALRALRKRERRMRYQQSSSAPPPQDPGERE